MHATRNIGLVGTGFIANGFARLISQHYPQYRLNAILTRRKPSDINGFPQSESLTNSIDELIAKSELIVECSGDPIHATVVIDRALRAGLPVVTMNSEFHITTGSYFVGKGFLTEAEGDQPGCLAALHEDVVQMGFKPLVYGNMKGYMNLNPSREDMQYWADRQGFSLSQTTSFTDGTKLQIEQAFIGNGMGATITRQGMEGMTIDQTDQAAKELAGMAKHLGHPIADYTISRTQPPGVFIAAEHDEAERIPLRNIKMGDGPFYVLTRNYHLCAIEIAKTVTRVFNGGGVLLDNSARPRLSVVAIAKTALAKGHRIEQAIGGFDLRGEVAVATENPNHVPMGVLKGGVVTRALEPGQVVTYDDVELPDSMALTIVRELFGTNAT
ncbi:MAG: SAF domain-containing protein [Thiotrichales bacterium]